MSVRWREMAELLKRREGVRMECGEMEEEDVRLNFRKKRKVYSKLGDEYCGAAEISENSVSPAASRTSGLSKHETSNDVVEENLRSPDLKNADSRSEDLRTEISTSTGCVFSREATPTSELYYGDSEHAVFHLPSKKKSPPPIPTIPRRKIQNSAAENTPSEAELEAFFVAAEKYEQKRFAEKYNYDIVKDIPLEGKYQWLRLLP